MSSAAALIVVLLCARETTGATLNNISSCYNFTGNEALTALILRSSLSFVSLMLGIPIVVLWIIQMCSSRKPIKNTDRLIIYISIATTLYASTQALQWLHLYASDTYCSVLGAIIEYVSLSMLVLTACVDFHLSLLILQTRCLKVVPKGTSTYRRQEIAYLLLTALLPLLFIPWPFIFDSYGESGAWCWIKLADVQCKPILKGVILSTVLYYAWAAVLLPYAVIITSVVVAILCCRKAQRPHSSVYALLGYLAIFASTTIMGGVGGVLLWWDSGTYGYLLVQTLSEPTFTVLSNMLVCFYMSWLWYHSRPVYQYYGLAPES